MWFGDLVTMRWWDDLWLNESFATFVSVLCQAAGDPLDLGLDDVRQHREDLGVPAGPAVLDATRSPPTSPTCRRSRSTSTGSRTRRARACSSSSPRTSGSRSSCGRCGSTSAATSTATPRWPTCSACWRRSPAGTCRGGRRSGWRRPGSTRCGPSSRLDEQGRYASFAIVQGPAEPRRPAVTAARPPARRSGCYRRGRRQAGPHRRVELDVRGARTEVPELVGVAAAGPAAGQRRRPDVREGPAGRPVAGHRGRAGRATSTTRCRGRCAGAPPGT